MLEPSIENRNSKQEQIIIRLLMAMAFTLLLLPCCFFFDLLVASKLNHDALPGDIRTILSCSEVFGHSYGVIMILATIWFASPQRRQQIKAIVLVLLASGVIVTALKSTIIRERPRSDRALVFDSVWETFHGYNPILTFDFSQMGISNLQSFPSGHSATAMTLGIGLAIIYPRAAFLMITFSLLACAQRIGFQAHYLSDVCSGILVSLALFAVFVSTAMGRKMLLSDSPEWPEQFPVEQEWQESPSANFSNAA